HRASQCAMAARCAVAVGVGVTADPALWSVVGGKQGVIAVRYPCSKGSVLAAPRGWHKASSLQLCVVGPDAVRCADHGICGEGDACAAHTAMESAELRRSSLRHLPQVLSVFPDLLLLALTDDTGVPSVD